VTVSCPKAWVDWLLLSVAGLVIAAWWCRPTVWRMDRDEWRPDHRGSRSPHPAVTGRGCRRPGDRCPRMGRVPGQRTPPADPTWPGRKAARDLAQLLPADNGHPLFAPPVRTCTTDNAGVQLIAFLGRSPAAARPTGTDTPRPW